MLTFLTHQLVIFILYGYIRGYKLPGSCDSGQFYEPSMMDCLTCPANVSLVTSADGFACTCEEHSIATGIARCKPCNMTEVVSSDGTMCVPRRCQSSAGRIVCRKCPLDYLTVTQNFDGSPMKEVQCIKCTRGYKVINNRCVKCEACSCKKHEIIVKGRCLPKKYVLDRPKYLENNLHPNELLEIVKLEYLCMQQEYRSCRTLASSCVHNFYTTDPGGPCRLWIQRNLVKFKGLPLLTLDSSKSGKIDVPLQSGKNDLKIATAIHTKSGGLKIFRDPKDIVNQCPVTCLPPIFIKIGNDFTLNCSRNITEFTDEDFIALFELYLYNETNFDPLSVTILKPNSYEVVKGKWPSKQFRKFFLVKNSISTITNTTDTVYLRYLVFRIRLERDASAISSLRLQMSIEAQYTTKSPLTDMITTSISVKHEMPTAGVLRGLEICGGVFCSLMTLYALVQWRGIVKRGGLVLVVIPILASYVANGLYFAALFSTLHALAAEAGTLALTLPLSQTEERVIELVIYIVVCLKALKILWINWNQCRCDIFFVDWSKYNLPTKGMHQINIKNTKDITIQSKSNNWKEAFLAREWISIQTKRRVSPGFTATSTLLILHLLEPRYSNILKSQGYKWVISSSVWWCSYIIFYCIKFLMDKLNKSQSTGLIKICTDLELSLLVFQYEYYGHYVDGRHEDLMDFRSRTHALQTCRLVCSPQLRDVYKKLTTNGYLDNHKSNHVLLSQFLSAFFERALDGLNWVASERTLLEKLLDVEFVTREEGNTSILLYDNDVTIPSSYAVTWWGEELTLATFDSMLFGCVLMMTGHLVLATLVTLIIWQIMKFARYYFGCINVKNKIGLND
ncbi:meckelin-like [Melitaea cinxia]|uniref:meckelin-like n=1 Tax=Melitaea cinxia TaxID=113334 RepID=UPI001E27122A|nr:meckelin-like [Melitaea cinxia]